MLLFMLNPKRLSLKEVAEFLGNSTKNLTSTKEWLEQRQISNKTKGCKKGISYWEFHFALQLEMVEDFKRKHPSTWHKIYRAGATDTKMMNAVFEVHPPETSNAIMRQSSEEVDFLK